MLQKSNDPKVLRRNLLIFADHLATKEQQQQLNELIEKADDSLLQFLISAYNDYISNKQYVNGHYVGVLSLITNPEALFRTPEAEKQFIIELKNYIRDAVGIKREDVSNGNNTNLSTERKTTKDK